MLSTVGVVSICVNLYFFVRKSPAYLYGSLLALLPVTPAAVLFKYLIFLIAGHFFPLFPADEFSGRKSVIVQSLCDQISLAFFHTFKRQLQLRSLFRHSDLPVFHTASSPFCHGVGKLPVVKLCICFRKAACFQDDSLKKRLLFFCDAHFLIFFTGNIGIIGISHRKRILAPVGLISLSVLFRSPRQPLISIGKILVFFIFDHEILHRSKAVQDRTSVQILIMLFPWRIQIHLVKKGSDTSACHTEIIGRTISPHIHGGIVAGESVQLIVAVKRIIFCIQHCKIRT